MMTREKLIGVAAMLGLCASGAWAGLPSGSVIDIEGALHGDWELLGEPSFIPGSQGGHFGLDTLSLQEFAPETVFPPGAAPRPAEHWADLWIKVYRTVTTAGTSTMIAVDKVVVNDTYTHWTDFHMELGVDIGRGFRPIDGLEFKTDPAPIEQYQVFPNPPMSMTSHDLWWIADDAFPGVPGLPVPGADRSAGNAASFWLGITIPNELFQPSQETGVEFAMITLRQHWTPSPGAAGVLSLAGVAALRRRRRA